MDSFNSQDIEHFAFIYGSLKKSYRNADLMADSSNGKAIYLGKGHTTTKYPLVVATEYNVPFLLNVSGQGHQIQGEIYGIDSSKLTFLDKFEGHPDLYKREDILVQHTTDPDGQPLNPPKSIQCSTYFLCEVKEDFLQLKWLEEFTAMEEDHMPNPIRNQRKVPLKTLVFPDRK